MKKSISKPSCKEIGGYIQGLSESKKERRLNDLFLVEYPKNDKIEDILIKCTALNDFYAMDVLYLFSISKNIYYLDFDKDIQKGDENLVMNVSKVKVDGKEKYFYSFATKFCNRHNPKAYPVYDEEIAKALLHFKKADSFYDFKDEKLEDYHEFKKILSEFKKHYDLEKIEFKDLEKYLRYIGGML